MVELKGFSNRRWRAFLAVPLTPDTGTVAEVLVPCWNQMHVHTSLQARNVKVCNVGDILYIRRLEKEK